MLTVKLVFVVVETQTVKMPTVPQKGAWLCYDQVMYEVEAVVFPQADNWQPMVYLKLLPKSTARKLEKYAAFE